MKKLKNMLVEQLFPDVLLVIQVLSAFLDKKDLLYQIIHVRVLLLNKKKKKKMDYQEGQQQG